MKRSPNTPTQRQRVERALRLAGARGITQIDFDAPALDGMAPIRRLASRVSELRGDGWVIDSSERRLAMARYTLVRETGTERSGATEPERQELSLLRPTNAVLGWDS